MLQSFRYLTYVTASEHRQVLNVSPEIESLRRATGSHLVAHWACARWQTTVLSVAIFCHLAYEQDYILEPTPSSILAKLSIFCTRVGVWDSKLILVQVPYILRQYALEFLVHCICGSVRKLPSVVCESRNLPLGKCHVYIPSRTRVLSVGRWWSEYSARSFCQSGWCLKIPELHNGFVRG
jgi:hypothetical protein